MTEAANLSRRDAVASVSLRRLGKTFGEHIAVRDLTLDIAEGEFFALLGPSGCGKTTTLRMIGGFEEPTSGDILVHGESMRGRPPFRRNVNTVFQSYALFPHLNVRDNVAFGLRMHGVGRKERAVRAERALERMHLLGVGHRAINEISGGQQQRVALARALVNEPAVLLLDEPLGALDLKLRRAMQTELKAIQRDVGITFVYVTHDQEEALTMADRIAVMHDGAALQVGTPREIYEHPTGRFVASFIGESTFLEGTCTGADGAHITLSLPTGEAVRAAGSGPPGGAVTVMVRPERIQVVLPGVQHSAELNEVAATVRSLDYAGASVVCHLERSDGEAVYARIAVDDTADLHPGRSVRVLFEPVHAVVLADDAQPAASDDGEAR